MSLNFALLRGTPRARRALVRARSGFTLIEALIATALLGFSLIVMFGFHTQAVRSNLHARKMTDCTYLAQLQMERLIALHMNIKRVCALRCPWTIPIPADLPPGAPRRPQKRKSKPLKPWPLPPKRRPAPSLHRPLSRDASTPLTHAFGEPRVRLCCDARPHPNPPLPPLR